MKNSLLFSLLLLFAVFSGVNGQNLLLNPGFENWSDVNTPSDWTKAENVTQESTIVHSGTYSIKHTADGTKDISQTVSVTEGTSYKISLWYYIESGDGTDARIYSYWRNTGTNLNDHLDELRLNNGYFPDEKGVWKNYEVILTAPATANELYFEVRSYGTAVVYWDDCLVEEYTPTGTVELTTPNGGEAYSAGQSVQIGWNSTGVSNVYFEVLGEDGTWEQISDEIASVDGANTYDFAIPANAWSWDGYKLKVVDATSTSIFDESDAAFSIDGHDIELLWTDFATDLTPWTAISVDVSGSAEWAQNVYNDQPHALINGYNAGENEDWLVSPVINLDNSTIETMEFISASKYGVNDGLVVKYSTDYDGGGDPSTATWVNMEGFTLGDGTDAWVKSGIVDISSLSGNVYFAFVYTCTDNPVRWRVADIYISGKDTATGLDKKETKTVKVVPNPFSTEFKVEGADVTGVILYNAAGQLVKNVPAISGVVSTSDLSKGMYILQIKMADGTVTTQKVIKK
nr:choice-of-anchor J domain-containing protein [uncultured Carboxylicivirga sp.]